MEGLMAVSDAVRELLGAHTGRSVAEIADDLGVTDINLHAKNAHAVTVRRLFEQRGLAAGLDQEGITVKVVRRGPDGRVFEKMTFRNFSHDELPRETWATSQLRVDTRRLLIVVFEAEERGLPIAEHRLVEGFQWRPSAEEDSRLQKDWARCREAVTYRLPTPLEKDTDAVHVGTKGRDAADVEETITGERVAKQCLCLNKSFVEELLAKYGT